MDKRLRLLKESWGKMSEIRVVGSKSDADTYFVAYRDILILFDEYDISPEASKAIEKINSKLSSEIEYYQDMPLDEPEEILYKARELRREHGADLYAGKIVDNELHLDVDPNEDFGLDIEGSVTLHKIARAVGVEHIKAEDYTGSVSYAKVKRNVDFPDHALHGTSSEYLLKILSQGLRPPKGERTNYGEAGVVHDNRIFLTTKAGKANGHAVNAAANVGGAPIIVAVEIPDKKQIDPDYDVDSDEGGTMYHDVRARAGGEKHVKQKEKNRPLGKSRDVGVFAYTGSIPKRYIKAIYKGIYDEDMDSTPHSIQEYEHLDVEQAIYNIQKIQDHYGDPASFFQDFEMNFDIIDDPYMIDEIFSDEEEDENY